MPDSGDHRSYSFSTAPGDRQLGFLIKKIPDGLMSNWLAVAKPGDRLDLTGPMGSFYLRDAESPLLFLAGGTGLAPFLSMLKVLARAESQRQVHLVYGATCDQDLVLVDEISAYTGRLPNFSFTTVVADPASDHPRKGWVTQHMPQEMLDAGGVDVYLCGPPPMVDTVRHWLKDQGVQTTSFHYEKFTPNISLKATA